MEETEQILNKLNEIKIEIEFIKEHMVDVDTILTPEEEKLLDESIENYKQGKTKSLAQIKKELTNV